MKKVIIIGAGPAGLTSAYELLTQSHDYQVTILEASDYIGGISRTVRYHGNKMDIGGHRFFSKDKRVMDWWKKIMPMQGAPSFDDKKLGRSVPLELGGPAPENTDNVMLSRNRVSRIYFERKFFDYPVKINSSTMKNMGLLTTMEAGFSYLASTVHKLPENSLENFYINRFGKKLYSLFFEGYTEKLWGRSPRDISADWGSQRVKGLSITAVLKDILSKKNNKTPQNVETSLIESFMYPKLGPGQLWEKVAGDIEEMGGIILKNSQVTNLVINNNRVTGIKYISDKKELSMDADLVISSMPLKDLVAGIDTSPYRIRSIADGLPYRDFVTVGLLVNKLNLKNETKIKTLNNIIPDCWIYVQDAGIKMGRIQVFNNWSPYLVSKPEENVWLGLEYFCTENDDYWKKSEEEWAELGISELIKMNILKSEDDVLDFHTEKVKKAYPAYFDTYIHIDELIEWINTINNLYCVGRNGQHRYNNMDHSMATAYEAVTNILNGSTDKSNIWAVNTEKEYHEEK